jgi:lantibiotic modifying enzyme
VCSTFWCHGAPGIALSRLRAFEVLGGEIYREEAVIALETTCEMIEESLCSGDGNFSLCHGLAGNADILLCGQELVRRASDLAVETAAVGIDRSKRQAGRWVCGAGPVETQSLLLGLAGIGYFFLRLRNQSIPSILLLRPDDLT